MCLPLWALGIEELTRDKNLFPLGDYLLPMGKSVKMVLMLVEKNRVGKKKIQLERGRRLQLQFVIFNRGSGKTSL